MRIVRFLDDAGHPRLGDQRSDGSVELLAGELLSGLRPTGQTVRLGKILAPLSPPNIFCIGLNYRQHARETKAPLPEHPVVFMKPTTTLTNPGDPIRVPACALATGEVDYECELAVVIGRTARDVNPDQALQYVLGYTAANDVSARRWQKGNGGQWVRGKSFDTFCPLGPALLTADEIPDPQTLRIRTVLNGQVMQESSTNDMIFTVAHLISFLSRDTTLLPGTLILTGTPQGVGFVRQPPVFLKAGDEVTVEVEKIGRLTNPVA